MRLEQNLPHQSAAINAVLRVFDGVEPETFSDRTKCPLLTHDIQTIKKNIAQIQSDSVPESLRENYTDSSDK